MAASGLTSGVMAGKAWHDGSSGSDALIAWAGMTVIGSLTSEIAKAPARNEAKRAAVEANVREFTTWLSRGGRQR